MDKIRRTPDRMGFGRSLLIGVGSSVLVVTRSVLFHRHTKGLTRKPRTKPREGSQSRTIHNMSVGCGFYGLRAQTVRQSLACRQALKSNFRLALPGRSSLIQRVKNLTLPGFK